MVRLFSLLPLLAGCIIDKVAYEEALEALSDDDGDGVPPAGGDCDDDDATRYPGATETWYDGVDQDCAGDDDNDADGDGDASEDQGGADCDDTDAAIHAGADETWEDDGIDNDCDQDAYETMTWSAYDATTRLDGVEAGGEAGRGLYGWEAGSCLFVVAPYTGDSQGAVYAETAGGEGVIALGSNGAVTGSTPYEFFATTVAVSSEGVAVMTSALGADGLGVAYLVDAASVCGGAQGAVDALSTARIEGPSEDAFFGVAARWLSDIDGDGVSELAFAAPGVSEDADGQGAVYLWSTPPEDGDVWSADDADVVLLGAYAGAMIEDVQLVGDNDERWLLISQVTVAEGDLALARIPVDGLVSGSVGALADGGIRSYVPGAAVTVAKIGDMDVDGSDNFVAGSFPWQLWDVSDLEGGIDAGDAPCELDYADEYLTGAAGIGDQDGDGRQDLVLLAEDAPGSSEQGRLAFFPGEALPPGSDVDFGDLHLTAEGTNLGDSFGYRAVPAGDFDGDGRADIAVAAPGMDMGGDQSGSVVLLPVPL